MKKLLAVLALASFLSVFMACGGGGVYTGGSGGTPPGSNPNNPYYTRSFQYYPLSSTLGTYGTSGTMVTYSGYQLPAYIRFLQLHGIESTPGSCSTASLSNVPTACTLLLTGVAQ